VRTKPERWRLLADFYHDVNNNNLPFFSWIDPGYADLIVEKASDEHPDHDVTVAETLLKKIYETLRASDYFTDTLLIVYYDEHGGFFDHVTPPHAPNPDGRNTSDQTIPFGFDRYGVRTPCVMVSPYIPAGVVASKPPLTVNQPQYSISSVIRTIREQYCPGVEPFTKRDAYSLSFENIVSLSTPRTDCPMKLPDVPTSSKEYERLKREQGFSQGMQPTNDFQQSLARSVAPLCGKSSEEVEKSFINQDAIGRFYKECVDIVLKSVKN